MILRVSFEEMTVVNAAVERLMSGSGGAFAGTAGSLAALGPDVPLRGDASVVTLAQQRRLAGAMDYLLEHLKLRMDALVLETYVGAEDAVNAYFDYANVLALRSRLAAVGRTMEGDIEICTGAPPTDETAGAVAFPDSYPA
jgi:hypothetical protein